MVINNIILILYNKKYIIIFMTKFNKNYGNK